VLRAAAPISIIQSPPSPVSVLTSSSNLVDYIVFDSNYVFVAMDLLPTKLVSTGLLNYGSSTTMSCSSNETVSFTVTPTVNVAQRIVI
jgi:hypothetical protein